MHSYYSTSLSTSAANVGGALRSAPTTIDWNRKIIASINYWPQLSKTIIFPFTRSQKCDQNARYGANRGKRRLWGWFLGRFFAIEYFIGIRDKMFGNSRRLRHDGGGSGSFSSSMLYSSIPLQSIFGGHFARGPQGNVPFLLPCSAGGRFLAHLPNIYLVYLYIGQIAAICV